MTTEKMIIQEPSGPEKKPGGGFLMLSYGFRPFFLLAGLSGAASLVPWLLVLSGGPALPMGMNPMLWHGHEMLFGFAGAALSGFLLTAVPSWTGRPRVEGAPLAALVALWLAGRIGFWMAGVLPPVAVALLDLWLMPALALGVGRSIFAVGQRRNYLFPILMLVMFAANLLFHLSRMEVIAVEGGTALRLGLWMVLIMLSIVAGRIVPNFTANALRMAGREATAAPDPKLERVILFLLLVMPVADVSGEWPLASGVLSVALAVLAAKRMAAWQPLQTLDKPILWVLHLGHAWFVTGFALKALADLAGLVPESAALHALTAGTIGSMVIAVITRAALGHTGRPLSAGPVIVVAYVLVSVGALLRVAAPIIAEDLFLELVLIGGTLWALAYGIYCVAYWPVLTRPRVDGRPG